MPGIASPGAGPEVGPDASVGNTRDEVRPLRQCPVGAAHLQWSEEPQLAWAGRGPPLSVEQLLDLLWQATFVLIFGVVAFRAWRRPLRANVDAALLFALPVAIDVADIAEAVLGATSRPLLSAVRWSLVMLWPYFLLRLVQDFADVPRWLVGGALAATVLLAAATFMFLDPRPVWVVVLGALYVLGVSLYAAAAFARQAGRSSGVTCRRLKAVAVGFVLVGMAVALAAAQRAIPALDGLTGEVLLRGCILAGALAFFLGFAPPAALRRAWQEPELRAFLGRAARLPRLPDTAAIRHELQRGAAASTGAASAAIALWDPDASVLRFDGERGRQEVLAGVGISGKAFATQRAVLSADAPGDFPELAEVYHRWGVRAVLAAPITAGERRLGVLAVYADKAPVFAEEDLELVQLLADQAAVILESRALIDEAARVRAREESTRLKDDFLSAAAHDLKTPLTTLVAQADLLARRAARQPDAPADLVGIERIQSESRRLRDLVIELLDASRAERGQLVGERDVADLVALAEEACRRHSTARHPCELAADAPVVGAFDRVRIQQLLDNLLENAAKYSPDGGSIQVRVWQEGEEGHFSVSDRGIGIPTADLPHVFDRYHRASNVDDRRYAGMGLGLYISRAIAEQHGGCIRAESIPGEGSTFHVVLPLTTPAVPSTNDPDKVGSRA